MASPEALEELRAKIGDTEAPYTYIDEVLGAMLDAAGEDTDKVASSIWRTKAASYASMVDISEAGSSRKNSDLFKNAQAMAEFYDKEDDVESGAGVSYTTTRKIVRP